MKIPSRMLRLMAALPALALALSGASACAGETPKPARPAADKAPQKADSLTAWVRDVFPYGEGQTTIDEVPGLKVPGTRIVRATKKWTADPRMGDQTYVVLDEDGKTAILGDLFVDEERAKAPGPVKTNADLDGIRTLLKRYFRGGFKVLLDPALDRRGWKGIRIQNDTGYGTYDVTGYVKADDGTVLMLGRPWDLKRPIAAQRLEMISLKNTPFQGPADARVSVVEYADMQCGYCKKRTLDWDPLADKLKSLLTIKRYIKFFPLTNEHPWALRAASAGVCFFEKSQELFFRWKSNVYSRQDEMSVPALDSFAVDFAVANDISEETFKGCYLQPASNARIHADLTEGFAVRVRSTPTYFVDGVLVSWFTDNIMEEYLRKTYLGGAGLPLPTPPPTPGPKPAPK